MTNEERDLIQQFIARVGGAPASSGFAGSVPATTPAQPPVDRDADAFIASEFARLPEARYRITQMAFVQEHALAEAQNQINRLQWELQNLKQQQAQAPAPAASPWGAAAAQPQPQQGSPGFFGGMFGGRQQAAPPPPPPPQYQQQPQYAPPQPQYAPGYQPGMFQPRGSGFLGSALTTAAGVAGGMVAGNALMNLFSGNHGGGFGGGGFGGGGFGNQASAMPLPPIEHQAAASPWAEPPAADPYEVGGLPKDTSGWGNQGGGFQSPVADQGGWQDAPSQDAGGGGWEDASGGSDDPDNS